MKHNLLSHFLLLCLVMAGCSEDAPETVFDVEKDFILQMRENLSEAGGTLFFPVKTSKLQECLNAGIDISFRQETDALSVSFNSIIRPDDCIDGQAPANGAINPGDLAFRDYRFTIDLKGEVVSEGILNVLSDRYVVGFADELGFEFEEKELMRMPTDIAWGYINHGQEEEAAADEALSLIEERGQEHDLEDGSYGWFRLVGGIAINVDGSPEIRNNKLFVLNYTESDTYTEELLVNLRADYPSLEFALFDWKGKSF